MKKKRILLAVLISLNISGGGVCEAGKILAQRERDNQPYTEYMEFGKDDHSAYITSNVGDETYNTWTFEQGASIDSTEYTGGNGWDAINFDAGYTWGGFEYKGVINIGMEKDRKKNFIVALSQQMVDFDEK